MGFYSCEFRLTLLAEAAGETRTMPDEFIDEAGTGVTDASGCTCARSWARDAGGLPAAAYPVEKVLRAGEGG